MQLATQNFSIPLAEVQKLVDQNHVLIPLAQQDITLLAGECIDERIVGQQGTSLFGGQLTKPECRIGLPGGKLGVAVDVLKGYLQIDSRATPEVKKEVLQVVFGAIGVSFHTDDGSTGEACACAGCGYMKAHLNNPEGFGLRPADSELLAEVVEDLAHKNVLPTVLKGQHTASGVLIVRGYEMSPLPTGDLFIYHPDYHRQAISAAVDALVDEEFLASQMNFVDQFFNLATEHLNAVVAVLAEGLDIFKYNDGEVCHVGTVGE